MAGDVGSAISQVNANVLSLHRELKSFEQTTMQSFASVDQKQNLLENELKDFYGQFLAFVKADLMQKKLQLAETRVGNLRQDLQIKFGYYAEIRRMANGIMQGVDAGIVSEETIKFTTEEVMIKAPKYWLAPTLVCLSSWISDNRDIAEKALDESLKRDDYKTTLFFMLTMRRLNRIEATKQWVERYFLHQDPKKLSREFVLILEGIVTGIFPPASKQLMMTKIQSWIDLLVAEPDFVQKQIDTWVMFYKATRPLVNDMKYPLLRDYAINWNEIQEDLRNVYSNDELNNFFTDILTNNASDIKNITSNLDNILSSLVTNFDDEELPLQREVRLNELIVEFHGDEDEAKSRMQIEEDVYSQEVDFLRLLTNAAFKPEESGASKVTQSLAVSISQPWILEANKKFLAEYRMEQQQDVQFNIDGWQSKTQNGSDEEELILQQDSYYENIRQQQLAANKLNYWSLWIGIGLGLILLMSGGEESLGSAVVSIIIGIVVFFWQKGNVAKKRVAINEEIDTKKAKYKEVLRGVLAEVVDLKTEIFIEDSKSQKLQKTIQDITPESFSSISADVSRNIIN